jgi:hypothetical protein
MLSGQFYVDEIEKQFSETNPESVQVDANFKPGLWGNYATNSMKPSSSGKIRNKMKTMKRMEPGRSNIDVEQLLTRFIKYQDDIRVLIDKSRFYDLNKIKIKSSIGRIIQFNLGNAFRFVIAHNQRHIQQALNVLHNEQFPKY